MSRIGKVPITIEEGVKVNLGENVVEVSGPLGVIKIDIPTNVKLSMKDSIITVDPTDDTKMSKSLHGTIRTILSNAVYGVKNGYEKKLEVVGVGYRAKMEGSGISIALGFNHPVKFEAPEGITLQVPDENTIIVKGFDKQLVGQIAAKIREIRKPEPYKGKGIRYEGENVRRKSAKSITTSK